MTDALSLKAEPARIAIVDDDPWLAKLVSDMLISGGVVIEVFALGKDLLKSVNLPHFKTIILDLSLPDLCGFDIMDSLAAGSIGRSIVLMSGHDPAVIHAAKTYGHGVGLQVRAALGKPFSRDELFTALGLSV